MAHIHSVIDQDRHFIINPEKRTIINQSEKITLMQFDNNSECFTFEIPRYIDGHDMSTCNIVQVHYMNNDSKTKQQNPGCYTVSDFRVSSEDETVCVGSWLVSGEATKFVGDLKFILRFICNDGISNVYVWSTAIYGGMSIGAGYNNSGGSEETPEQILSQIDELINESGVVEYDNSI